MCISIRQTACHFALIASLAVSASAQSYRPLPAAIWIFEADEKFDEARKQLDALPATRDADVKAHVALMDQTASLLALVDAYTQSGLTRQAIDALTAFLPTVSQGRDAGLAIAVQRRIVRLQQPNPTEVERRKAGDEAAESTLRQAELYLDRGLAKQAKDAYENVLKVTDPIGENLRISAMRGATTASQRLFDDEPFGVLPTLLRSLRDAARTIRDWTLPFLVAAAIIFVWRRVWLTGKRSLALVDHSLPAPSAAADRELTQQLQDVIQRITRAAPGSARLEVSGAGESPAAMDGELPPPELAFITPTIEVPDLVKELDGFVASAPTIQLGGIGFNPQQLWAFIKRAITRRPRHAITGTLSTYDNVLTLRLTREDRLLGRKSEWRASAPQTAPDARTRCLVELASHLVLDGRHVTTATTSHRSLTHYMLGLYALDAAGSPVATDHFRTSLTFDAGNWLARFQLGLCARGMKDARTAIRSFEWFDGPDAKINPSLRRHIVRHPDFPHIVRYQLASVLSFASGEREDVRVGTILKELVSLEGSPQVNTPEGKALLRLVMFARSSQSTREAVRISLNRRDPRIHEIARQIVEHLAWFDSHASDLGHIAAAEYTLARAIVLHAYGRIRFSLGDKGGAIDSLTEAVSLLPTYADIHVDLAKAHLEDKERSDWPQLVIAHLDHALALNQHHAKAQFVYARFFFTAEARDLSKAEPYLRSAPFDPTSLFMLAQVLHSRGSYTEALETLERAIALRKEGPSFRVRLYAKSLLELVGAATNASATAGPTPSKSVLTRKLQQLCKYEELFADAERQARNYQRTGAIYADICSKLGVQPGTCFASPSASAPASDGESVAA